MTASPQTKLLRYEPLELFLKDFPTTQNELTLSFRNIEAITHVSLPKSAYEHREWWSNQSDIANRPQAAAWIKAGFAVDVVHQEGNSGWVRFIRMIRR